MTGPGDLPASPKRWPRFLAARLDPKSYLGLHFTVGLLAKDVQVARPGEDALVLAAGLLGGGSRFLGVTEDAGVFLHEALSRVDGPMPADDAGWDHSPPAPELPPDVVEQTRAKYVEAYERISGRSL